MKNEPKMYGKVITFKVQNQQDAQEILYKLFDTNDYMRSLYVVETKKGVTLVVHHEGQKV